MTRWIWAVALVMFTSGCNEAPAAPSEEPGGNGSEQAEQWRGLTVAPETRCAPYDADDYSYRQSVELEIIAALGGIWSPYTCEIFQTRFETDIEHIVARSEAHDSGLCAADAATKRRFAEDLDNLTLAAPNLNRFDKVAKDASEWLPEHNACWYVQTTIDVRRKYGLTIDAREAAAVDRVLAGCTSTAISCAIGGWSIAGATTSNPTRTSEARRYRNCRALRAAGWTNGVSSAGTNYDSRYAANERAIYAANRHLDGDGDGHACE